MRRGLTICLRLSLTGELEAGPGGGPASCCLEISPFVGRREAPCAHTMRLREPAAWAAESDRKRCLWGRPTGRPFLLASGTRGFADLSAALYRRQRRKRLRTSELTAS
jgi:hypothetical protein